MKVVLASGRIVMADWLHVRRPGTVFLPVKTEVEGGEPVAVRDEEGHALYKKVPMPKGKGGKTRCAVAVFEKEGDTEPMAMADAIVSCSKNDNYSRSIGRGKSLSLALSHLKAELTKEDRTELYAQLKEKGVSL